MNSKEKIGSLTHKLIKNYLMSDYTISDLKEHLRMIYDDPSLNASWVAYTNAVKKYDSAITPKEKVDCAIDISDCAIKLRNESNDLKSLIMMNHVTSEIIVKGLTADESHQILKIIKIMKSKNRRAGPNDNANTREMFNSFVNDIEIFNQIGLFENKWFENNRIAKMIRYSEQNNLTIPELKKNSTITEKLFKSIKDAYETESQKELTDNNDLSNASNKFMVDYIICVSAQFKSCGVKFDDFFTFAHHVSIFTGGNNMGKLNFEKLVSIQKPVIKKSLEGISQMNSLYMNPGKLTIPRLYGFCSIFNKTITVHGILQNRIKTQTFKLISQLSHIDPPSEDPNTTSDSEYLLHKIMTKGENNQMSVNENKITKSAFTVNFKFID